MNSPIPGRYDLRPAVFVAVIPLIIATAALAAYRTGLRINATYSLPLGLYVTTSDPGALLVEFCPTGRFAVESSNRGYRGRSWACPDGEAPLLKPVVARAGDVVETTTTGIAVNGQLLPNTAPLFQDGKGRDLSPWPFGIHRVEAGTIWVASTYNKGSYDSRYMGPIPLAAIRAHLNPILTFNSKGARK